VYKVFGVEQTGRDEPSREQPPYKTRRGETDVVSIVADSVDEQDGAERSQRTGCEILRRYRDVVAEFHTISRYKKLPAIRALGLLLL